MQTAGQSFFRNIAPHATRAMGSITGLEARLDRHDQRGIMDPAGAGRAVEPGVQAGARTSSASQSPLTGRMCRCPAMKANLMSPRARKKRSAIVLEPMAEKGLTLLEEVTLRPEPDDLLPQGCDPGRIGTHLPVPGKGQPPGARSAPSSSGVSRTPGQVEGRP